MQHLTIAPPRPGASAAFPAIAAPADAAPTLFWSEALGAGAGAILELCPQVDAMSHRVGKLPIRISVTRPVVGQYLVMLKTLAAAWGARSRPALAHTLGGLAQLGHSMAQADALEALAGQPDGARAALRALDALQRRLAAPLAAAAALDSDMAGALANMARASAELEADTRLVTQRLQADYVHAFMLSQQASTLQNRLDDATLRQQDAWLAGPHAGALRQEMSLHRSALEGVRRQLEHLRAEQSATQAEADYLQSLLPTLKTYLGTVERMAAGIGALLAGACALALAFDQLRQTLGRDPGAGAAAGAQLAAALPHWEALAAASAAVLPSAQPASRDSNMAAWVAGTST